MVVKLPLTGHLGYFLETQIISVLLLKREYHMDEILAQLCDIGYTLMTIIQPDHTFQGNSIYRADGVKAVYKMTEQGEGMFAFAGYEIG